jgi:hypothetical protein
VGQGLVDARIRQGTEQGEGFVGFTSLERTVRLGEGIVCA